MLKGVGRSPLSVARVGLLGEGPESHRDKVWREEDKKKRQRINETAEITYRLFTFRVKCLRLC